MSHVVIIMGPGGVGKSALKKCLVDYNKQDNYKNDYDEIEGFEESEEIGYGCISDSIHIYVLKTIPKEPFAFYGERFTVLYCDTINDLRQIQKNRLQKIKQETTLLRNNMPNANLILVGTKSDTWDGSDAEFKRVVENIETKMGLKFDNSILTSSNKQYGIKKLRELFDTLALDEQDEKSPELTLDEQDEREDQLAKAIQLANEKDLSFFSQSQLKKLQEAIKDLTPAKKIKIEQETHDLVYSLTVKPELEGLVEKFLNNCTSILNGKHPYILKTIVGISVTVAVTLIVGVIGFAIGFAAGAWSGPGAFLTALLSGVSAAAIAATSTSCALGLTAGAYTFFRDSAEIKALKDVRCEANNVRRYLSQID